RNRRPATRTVRTLSVFILPPYDTSHQMSDTMLPGAQGASLLFGGRAEARPVVASGDAQHEPPAELDLGGEPVRERVLLRVDHHASAGVEPAHALTREHGNLAGPPHLALVGPDHVVREEMGRRPLTAALAEHEHERRSGSCGLHLAHHPERRPGELDRHAPNSAPYQNLPARLRTSSRWMCLICMYSRMPSMPNSRPMPLCLYPPKGAATDSMWYSLIHIVPVRTRFATSHRFVVVGRQAGPTEPVDGIVRDLNGVVEFLVADDHQHGPEDLLLCHSRRFFDVGQDGRLAVVPLRQARRSAAADGDL